MEKLNTIGIALFLASISTASMAAEAVAIGKASGRYTVGEVLYDNSFDAPNDWIMQIQDSDSETEPMIEFREGLLDIYMPFRGCTAWLSREFRGPIAIVYRVRCPEDTLDDEGIQARDINNFWHATDPVRPDRLLDSEYYTGEFTSYHKMHGYYASTGGGGVVGNQTTRARRYPRNDLDGNPVPHIALNDRDGQEGYLITPGIWHTVQLVAADGLVQYIVDGKIVYEYDQGDTITVEHGALPAFKTKYTFEEFPVHSEGYFGLRMVRTHHQYSDLAVYQLKAISTSISSNGL